MRVYCMVIIVACIISSSICFYIPSLSFLPGHSIIGEDYSLSVQTFDNTSPIYPKYWLLWTVVQAYEDTFPTEPTSYILSYYQRNSSKTGLQWKNGTAVPLYDCTLTSVPSGASYVPKGSGSSSSRIYVGCFQSSSKPPYNIAWEYDITHDDLRTFSQVFSVPHVNGLTQFVGMESAPGFVYALGETTVSSFFTILKFDLATLTLQNYTQIQVSGSSVASYLVTDDKFLYLSTGLTYTLGQLLIYDGDLNLVKNITQTNIVMYGPGSYAPLQSMMIFFGRNSTDFPYQQNGVFIGVDTNGLSITKLYGLETAQSTSLLPGYATAVDLTSTNFFGILGDGVVQLDIDSFSVVAVSQHIPFPPDTYKESQYAYTDPELLCPIPSGVLHTSPTAPTLLVGSNSQYTNVTLFVTPVIPV